MNKLLEISQTYSSISSQLGPSRSQAKIIFICFLPKQFFSNNCTFSCNVSKACQVLQERSFLLNPFPGPIMITSVITNFCVNKDIFFNFPKKHLSYAFWAFEAPIAFKSTDTWNLQCVSFSDHALIWLFKLELRFAYYILLSAQNEWFSSEIINRNLRPLEAFEQNVSNQIDSSWLLIWFFFALQ